MWKILTLCRHGRIVLCFQLVRKRRLSRSRREEESFQMFHKLCTSQQIECQCKICIVVFEHRNHKYFAGKKIVGMIQCWRYSNWALQLTWYREVKICATPDVRRLLQCESHIAHDHFCFSTRVLISRYRVSCHFPGNRRFGLGEMRRNGANTYTFRNSKA